MYGVYMTSSDFAAQFFLLRTQYGHSMYSSSKNPVPDSLPNTGTEKEKLVNKVNSKCLYSAVYMWFSLSGKYFVAKLALLTLA